MFDQYGDHDESFYNNHSESNQQDTFHSGQINIDPNDIFGSFFKNFEGEIFGGQFSSRKNSRSNVLLIVF